MNPLVPHQSQLVEWALVAMLASASAALVTSGAVDLPAAVLTTGAILLRLAALTRYPIPRLPDTAATAIALAAAGFYPLDVWFLSRNFLLATVHLVLVLSSLLIVRASTRRDYFFVKLIALVEMLAAALVASGPLYLLFFLTFAFSGIVAQMAGEIRAGIETGERLARYSHKAITARLLPLAVFAFAAIGLAGTAIFIIVPRTAVAAFHHFNIAGFRVPGFASEVRLDETGAVRQSTAPVFHARFYSPEQGSGLKWRGSALAEFDGQRWFNPPDDGRRLIVENRQVSLNNPYYAFQRGRRIAYEVRLESLSTDALFFAGVPELLRIDTPALVRTSVDGYRTPGGRGSRYQVYSLVEDPRPPPSQFAPALPLEDRIVYLRMPSLDRRIAELARQVTAGRASELAIARALERHLESAYAYTATLPSEPHADPLAHFLFERKQGHCEFFASAMAVMLRTLGIPSRIATGFQPGIHNPITGWNLVRASDAHSWVEAFLNGYGWVSFDPTPAALANAGGGFLDRLHLYRDALDVFYQEWVLAYDLERQVLLAGRLARSSRASSVDWAHRWQDLKAAGTRAAGSLPLAAAIAAACAALFFLTPPALRLLRTRRRVQNLKQGRAQPADATLLYERMLGLLHGNGIEKPTWFTANEFAAAVPNGRVAVLVRQATDAYHALRFGGDPSAAPRLVGLVEQLEQELRVAS